MGTLLLSSPLFHLYLLFLAALTLAAFWPDASAPHDRQGGLKPLMHGLSRGQPQARGNGGSRLAHGLLLGTGKGREPFPVRDTGASLSEEYAAKFSRAIKRIPLYGDAP
jgi:hypothetical protein